jgi:hypothetical protein
VLRDGRVHSTSQTTAPSFEDLSLLPSGPAPGLNSREPVVEEFEHQYCLGDGSGFRILVEI